MGAGMGAGGGTTAPPDATICTFGGGARNLRRQRGQLESMPDFESGR
jgi:hypothetical protein